MKLESQVALLTIRSQPRTILDCLLRNGDLLDYFDLTRESYPGLGAFAFIDIVAALEKIHAEGQAVSVRTMEGKECRLDQLPEGIKATLVEGDEEGRIIPEFGLLAPDKELRLKIFSDILADAWPCLLSANKWESVLGDRPLSGAELSQLVDEIRSSPGYFLSELQSKWQRGRVGVQDLVPLSSFYYESLLGPLPDGHNVDDYLREILKPHLRKLVDRDLSIGLEISLPAYLRDDISPYSLLDGVADKAVLDELTKFLHYDNPFALLGVLDIALRRRVGYARFDEVASEVVKRLTQGALAEKDGVDYYALMPPLVRLCYRQLSVSEIFGDTPPYWRLLASFVHTNFLIDIFRNRSLDVANLSSWCDGQCADKMIVKQLIDMQLEPMATAAHLTAAKLRAEVIGRLLNLSADVRQQCDALSLWDQIERAAAKLQEEGSLIFAGFPGPLEGNLRRKASTGSASTTSSDVVDILHKISADLEVAPNWDIWTKLAVYSHVICFDSEFLGKLDSAVRRLSLPVEDESRKLFFDAVANAALLASTQSAEILAETVAELLAREATNFRTDVETETGYRILLVASAAFSDRTQWRNWLGQKMTDYVYSLPRGNQCAQLHQSLGLLQTLLPIKEWCFGKAMKMAAAAMR